MRTWLAIATEVYIPPRSMSLRRGEKTGVASKRWLSLVGLGDNNIMSNAAIYIANSFQPKMS